MRGSKEQAGAVEAFTQHMRTKLAKKPSVMDQMLPSFPPACRRLTPGPGYLEALSADNVDVISDPIDRIVTDGVVTSDGRHRPVDAIACATGFDATFTGRFPIIGENGVLLSEKWKHTPTTYLSLATDGFPNYFIYLGPASGLGTGNLLVLLEKMAEYFIDCVAKMQRDNIRAMKVKKSAVKRFVAHSDRYFQQTVFSMRCRSWYKGGSEDGRVNALWPGKASPSPGQDQTYPIQVPSRRKRCSSLNCSCLTGSSLHALQALQRPRWEDYSYEYVHENPMGWLGDGWTANERNHCINVDYLDYENIDFPPAAESSAKLANGVQHGVAITGQE